MNTDKLINLIKTKKSFLCVGLDTDSEKNPESLKKYSDPVFEFNKRIIDATLPYCIAYKPNMAFYECNGSKGWISLEKTMQYIRSLKTDIFTIADAKRGDIGNSAKYYAKAIFDLLGFDAVTVSPLMGYDSVEPFLKYENKTTILLALTSNKGAEDFLRIKPQNSILLDKLGVKSNVQKMLYEFIIEKALGWGNSQNLMFVVGATQTDQIKNIRELAPENFFLVPGLGTQGGKLENVAEYGMNKNCGLIVNSSRSIIFASQNTDFDKAAANEAHSIQQKMEQILRSSGFI